MRNPNDSTRQQQIHQLSSRTKRSNKNALLHFTEVKTCGFCDSHDHGEMLSSTSMVVQEV